MFGKKIKDLSEIESLRADAILITSILEKERILRTLKKMKDHVRVFSIS